MKRIQLFVIFVLLAFLLLPLWVFPCVAMADDSLNRNNKYAQETTGDELTNEFDAEEAYRNMTLIELPPSDQDQNLPEQYYFEQEQVEMWYDEITVVQIWVYATAGVTTLFWLVMLVNAIIRPLSGFAGVGRGRKFLWILLLLFTHVIGALVYFFKIYRFSPDRSDS